MKKSQKDKHNGTNNLCGVLFEPGSDWTPPPNFPDLSSEKLLGIDIETRDPNLLSKGPGFLRKDAEVVGITVATSDRAWYYPIAHLGGGNVDRTPVIRFVGDLLKDPNRYIVGANLQYDLEGLSSLGIDSVCKTLDIQVAEALLDEERSQGYSLDVLAKYYLKTGKDESLLREAADAYGIDPKGGLWKLPSKYVGAYAEYDGIASMQILDKQMPLLKKEDLLGIFEIECRLLPVLWKMRKQGIPIDMDAVEKLSKELKKQERDAKTGFKMLVGYDIDPWSGDQIEKLCKSRGIVCPRTPKGNPSFTGEWLEEFSDPAIQCIAKIRKVNRMRSTFVDDWFKTAVNGTIHPQWKQLASDDGGTRTGRMAASNPNPQQVPAGKFRMTGEASPIGKAIRACFSHKELNWCKLDYSQQEPRILTHFAAVCEFTGAKLARMAYQKDRKMDFYQFMVEVAGIDRRPAKDMYLGRCYGMGKAKLAVKLGKSLDECADILARFDERVPFIKEIADSCMLNAQKRGYIKTLLGRRRHFNFWEPTDSYQMRKDGHDTRPLSYELAKSKWPDKKLQRSNTHKALNALIQGSAADMLKAAILSIHDELSVIPYMAVHDELDIGVVDRKQAEQCQELAENCVEMTVPIRADMDFGRHWK